MSTTSTSGAADRSPPDSCAVSPFWRPGPTKRDSPRYEPDALLRAIQPKNFRWADLQGLVPRRLQQDHDRICAIVRERFDFLADCTEAEQALLADQTAHREHTIFRQLRDEARAWASATTS